MAITWGAYEPGSLPRIRVGIEVTWSAVDTWDNTVTATVDYYTGVDGGWSDNQHMTLSGAITGGFDYYNGQSSGTSVKRATRTYTYTYPSDSYGSSPGTRTFSASVSGCFNGATPSVSVTRNIPARPYAEPLAPTGVSVARVSDTSQKVSWTNENTAPRPWNLVRIQIDGPPPNDIWNGDVGTSGGGSTYFTDSGHTSANGSYKYRVRSENSVGVSAWVETATIHTTPAAPSSPYRSGTGSSQSLSWVNNVANSIPYETQIWRAVDDSWSLLATVNSGVSTYTDSNAPVSSRVKYKFRAKTTSGPQGTLYSAYSAETTETLGATSPPSAPTNLSPNGVLINSTLGTILSWQHNPTDGTDQTAAELQWREQGGTFLLYSLGTSTAYIFPAGTFPANKTIEWQVRTKGADPTYSPWSALATFDTVGDANSARRYRRAVTVDIETGEHRAAPEGSLVPTGVIAPFMGAAQPPGWLVCEGQILERADYPDLFSVIGTRYATGAETSTQFSLPDLRDRFLLGASTSHGATTTGGSEYISEWNMPSHDHEAGGLYTASNGSHTHNVDQSNAAGSYGGRFARGTSNLYASGPNGISSEGGHTHTIDGYTANTGGGGAYWPRYLAVNWIIKA